MYDPELAIKYWKLWQADQYEAKIDVVSAKAGQFEKINGYTNVALALIMTLMIVFAFTLRDVFWYVYMLFVVALLINIFVNRAWNRLLNQYEELVNKLGRVLDDD